MPPPSEARAKPAPGAGRPTRGAAASRSARMPRVAWDAGGGGHQDGVLTGLVVVAAELADGDEAAVAVEGARGTVPAASPEPHETRAAKAAVRDGDFE